MYLSAFMLNFRCSSWGSASKFSMLFFVLFHDQSRCLSFNIDTLSRISLWHIKGMLILNQTYWSIAGIPLIGLSRVTCRKRNRCECDQDHHQTIEYRREGVRFSLPAGWSPEFLLSSHILSCLAWFCRLLSFSWPLPP